MASLENIERELYPFNIYREMRETQPVSYEPGMGGWNIFRYEDVFRVLSDYEVFSSQFRGGMPASTSDPFSASLISTDPPRHRQLRGLVTQAFTPKAVEALGPRIEEIVRETLAPVEGSGRMDVIDDLAYPLPVIVIAELMGIPAQDRQRFKKWSDIVVQVSDSAGDGDYRQYGSVMSEMAGYFFEMIERRRREPGSDLISGLLQANIEGQGLDMPELLGFCVLLLVAGNETTTNLLGNAMVTFAEHPEAWQELRAEPALLPQAIEEVLRFRSPVQSMYRVTKKAARLTGDMIIPAGEAVVAWIGSANHDENQFERPEQFDIRRAPNRHIAFGQGIHYCLGAPLARLEARTALAAMLKRIERFELAADARLERVPSTLIYGLRHVPIVF